MASHSVVIYLDVLRFDRVLMEIHGLLFPTVAVFRTIHQDTPVRYVCANDAENAVTYTGYSYGIPLEVRRNPLWGWLDLVEFSPEFFEALPNTTEETLKNALKNATVDSAADPQEWPDTFPPVYLQS